MPEIFLCILANDDKDDITSSSSSGSSDDESPTSSSKPSKQGPSQKSLRDSGCFEEDPHNNQRKTKGSSSKSSDSSNNLDSVGRNIFFASDGRKTQKSLSVIKQFQNSGGGGGGGESSENLEMDVFSNHAKVNYQPNIPVGEHKKTSTKDFLEQTREVLDRAREIANNSREILERSTGLEANESSSVGRSVEESCETNAKLTMVKYVVGGYNDLGVNCESGNAGFSEKSSDSGVSSSSMSSANFKERKIGQATVESPKAQRLDSPKKSDKMKIFSPICDSKKVESLNPFLKNSKSRLAESSRSSERSESKNQEIENSNSFSSQFQNRSLIVQKKT